MSSKFNEYLKSSYPKDGFKGWTLPARKSFPGSDKEVGACWELRGAIKKFLSEGNYVDRSVQERPGVRTIDDVIQACKELDKLLAHTMAMAGQNRPEID